VHPAFRQVFQAIGLAYYHAFLGPRGRGRSAPVDTWDRQYRTGHWDNFETANEMPRYAVIASYIRGRGPGSSILDVGCGYGRLVDELHSGAVGRYVGIDLSAEAVRRAQSRASATVSFAVGDFGSCQLDETFDVVVFNDTLYYADHPTSTLDRFAAKLNPDGVLIVAMYRHRNTMVIWKAIEQRFAVLDRFEVKNGIGEVTDIRSIAPRLGVRTAAASTPGRGRPEGAAPIGASSAATTLYTDPSSPSNGATPRVPDTA